MVPGQRHDFAKPMYEADQVEPVLIGASQPAKLSSVNCLLDSRRMLVSQTGGVDSIWVL